MRDIRLDGLDAVFIDPARRSGPGTASAPAGASPARLGASPARPGGTSAGQYAQRAPPRRFRAGQSEPPLDWCFALADRVPAVCVKAAPGLPADLIPDGWEAEFIADGRDLKEAVLWSPALATAPVGCRGGPRRALVHVRLGTAHPGRLPR